MTNKFEQYKTIKNLSSNNKGSVYIIKEVSSNSLLIKKELNIPAKVYKQLIGIKSAYLPRVYYVNESEDKTVIIEEYIEGTVLTDYDITKLPYCKQIDILLEICKAIEVLHSYSIIHRDIKPDNIMITENCKVKLIDFDTARLKNNFAPKDTRQLGTIGYAPPEQYGFCQTDERSDIYSFGVLINTVFEGKQSLTLRHIINKCTRFDPNKRYTNILKVRRALSLAKYITL